jgi:hypothetical protein
MEQMKEKLIEHDFAINAMVKSIQELSDTTKDSNIKLGDLPSYEPKQDESITDIIALRSVAREFIRSNK